MNSILGRAGAVAMSGALAAFLSPAGVGMAHGGYGHAPQGTSHANITQRNSCKPLTKFKRKNFEDSAEINNKFYPLKPGTQFTLEGQTSEGPRTVIFTVTDFVKEIDGVQTRVLWDQDIQNGVLVESELAFQAQDESGNVWVLGEFPEEFENGQPIAPNTWISGINDAMGGVLVPGKPKKGQSFLEGSSPDIDFLDCGKVFKTSADHVCAGGKCYDDVLIINETSPPDPAIQRKFYAPHVGNIKITAVDDPEGEFLDLTSKVKLNSADRIDADLQALALEQTAFQISPVFQKTEPMEFDPCPGDDESTSALRQRLQTFKRALNR